VAMTAAKKFLIIDQSTDRILHFTPPLSDVFQLPTTLGAIDLFEVKKLNRQRARLEVAPLVNPGQSDPNHRAVDAEGVVLHRHSRLCSVLDRSGSTEKAQFYDLTSLD